MRNEEWIVERFIRCMGRHCDRIVLADQQSTDRTREIAAKFQNVSVIENDDPAYSEARRQRLLIDFARRERLGKVFLALDADEILSSDASSCSEWEQALDSPSGTVLMFPRVELYGTPFEYFRNSAECNQRFAFGYIDDGAEHVGIDIHSHRVPFTNESRTFLFTKVVVLHFQFCDLQRMRSKHRWYRCFERTKYPQKSASDINKLYGWMDHGEKNLRPCPGEWLQSYLDNGIEFTSRGVEETYWWDWEVLRMFAVHPIAVFEALDIWDVDWEEIRLEGLRKGVTGLPENRIVPPGRKPSFSGLLRLIPGLGSRWAH